jgi:hypothetical protein
MPRKLKTFQTSVGFYDLAVAAPSMKAALEAWGAGSNLFHQGMAKETDDPDVIAATMSRPGVVLRRPAGSSGHFAEHSELPTDLGSKRGGHGKTQMQPKKKASKLNDKAERKAALDFEEQQKRREAESRREEAALAKERKKREKAVAKAQAALDEAMRDHQTTIDAIEADRATIERKAEHEEKRWQEQKARLERALRTAHQL